ncbi:MAG: Thiol-disulfide oxidoreductase ResA [Verrucomicrobia subdivision 3 bacterium]|nr:Thiol-disulfide oxidoreductase ResA [Limisphaerales bacterium]MCS1414194.1 Thiol-disulfide oxidoreductase ResA [Limisphaerales bacterium]
MKSTPLWLILLPILALHLQGLAAENETDSSPPDAPPDKFLEGHSAHGEAFNEGPRQAAYFMGTTGDVHFPITTISHHIQQFFDQGIGQLHGFWYLEAERTFRHIAALEPDCAMAYWGMAMANINNRDRAKDFIQKAVDRKDTVSPREKLWIESLEHFYLGTEKPAKKRSRKLIRDLEEIVYQYPDDIEAKAFLAVTIYQNKRHHPIASHQAVSSLIQQVFDVNPMHPAHHYRIHLWDREKPERALASAVRCGQSAPGIAHMWHMPGHIFSHLHRYADAAWQQEASARVDHAHMMRDRILPDQIHNFAHNNEWLIRNLNHLGRVHDAIELAKNMIELPRHPKYNLVTQRGRSASYGRRRLMETLVRYNLWNELVELANTVYLEPTDVDYDQIQRQLALGLAAYHSKDIAAINAAKEPLETLLQKKRSEHLDAADEAETKTKEDKKQPREAAEATLKYNSSIDDDIRAALAELDTYISILEARPESAKELLAKTKRIPPDRLARLHLRLGNTDKAIEIIAKAKESDTNQVQTMATAIEIFHATGKLEDATLTFQELQEISGHIDLDIPIFRRITKLAPDLGIETNWQRSYQTPPDVGDRPELTSLGPFRWHPWTAPEWKLKTAQGEYRSLADYKGKPLLLVFYLGYGCAHCVEQLNIIALRIDDFAEQDIAVAAISTEALAELEVSLTKSKLLGKLSFPLLSNDALDVFKDYRAFDDFEKTPLHGTYLIDGDGLVRWLDINYEPFTDIDFILNESKRLLAQPKSVELAKLLAGRPRFSRDPICRPTLTACRSTCLRIKASNSVSAGTARLSSGAKTRHLISRRLLAGVEAPHQKLITEELNQLDNTFEFLFR